MYRQLDLITSRWHCAGDWILDSEPGICNHTAEEWLWGGLAGRRGTGTEIWPGTPYAASPRYTGGWRDPREEVSPGEFTAYISLHRLMCV